MPSPLHDAINQMIRDRPESALEMLRDLKGVDIPQTPLVRVESNAFNDRPSKDFTPDTVISAGPPRQPFHGLIVEVQQEPSESKRKQLPRYAASLWLMLDCPVTLLCICPDAATAKFFAKPIPTDLPGYVAQVVVLGPDDVPAISIAGEVAAHPEVAALSVLVHRERKVAEAFVDGLSLMSNDHASQYYEYAYDMASRAVRRTLEELMTSTTWRVSSPFAREHFGRGKADSLLLVLKARGMQVPDSVRERILHCTDTDMLDDWTQRALVIDKVEDLFD